MDTLFIVAKPNSLCFDFLTLPPNNFDNTWCPKHIPRIGIPSIKIFLKNIKGKDNKAMDFLLNYIDENFKDFKDGLEKKEITPDSLLEKFNMFNTNLK